MTRILIIDDKEENLYYLQALLSGHGYEVDTARHGAEALVIARRQPPGLVVSDLLMPVMDGYTLLRHWKGDERLKNIPFIVYTATYTEPEDERLALSLGADAFILKPAEPEEFLKRIRELENRVTGPETASPPPPAVEEKELLKVYSETLIRKLEQKMLQLEETNQALERDIAERTRAETERQKLVHDLGERVKELRTLYDVAGLLREDRASVWEVLERVVEILPSAMQYPEISAARVEFRGEARAGANFLPTPWMIEAVFGIGDGTSGRLQVVYLEERPAEADGPFLAEERHLISSLAEMLRGFVEKRAALEDRERTQRDHERHHSALVQLTRNPLWHGGDETAVLREITETVSRALEVARASFWRYSPNRDSITCLDLFESGSSRHSSDQVLMQHSFPSYFKALAAGDIIPAEDARRDPRTREFTTSYLEPLDIAAMLDAPVRVGGELAGVLCLEHTGKPRAWTPGERSLALAAANMLSLVLAQSALAMSESRLRTIVESEPECVKVVAAGGELLDINPAGLRMIEADTRDEVIGRQVVELVHPDDREAFMSLHHRGCRGETGQLEFRLNGYKGAKRWMETHSTPLREANGDIASVLSVTRDISERRRAESTIREQAALLDKAQDAILVRDLDHRITYWNFSAGNLYGWTAEEAVGRSVQELLYQESAAFEVATATVMEKGEWVGELEQVTKDGRALTVQGRWTLVRDDHGNPKSILAINTDVTEKKKLESQLLRNQRMESIGTLAGGIAHDLNNVLAPILISIELFKLDETDPERLALLSTVENSARHGAELVKQVLSFARGVEGNPMVLNLQHLARDLQQIIKDTFPKKIDFRLHVDRDLWTVNADATQLHQVMMNLCVNARDAMPQGGRLTLSLKNEMIDEVFAGTNPGSKAGRHVVIEVSDTGTGIPADIRERIFDPFFTTKEIGKGTGLGLATVLTIVNAHGGFINVYSEPGRGTRFKVCLPAAEESELRPPAEAPPTKLPAGNGELVLVVDDDEAVRMITRKTLEHFGYRVVTATNGAEASAIYAEHRSDIAVVLTDMAMPVMDGPATIVALKAMNPAVKIIGSSGHAQTGAVNRAAEAGVKHFIPKPYTAETLLRIVHQILRESH